MANKRKNKRKTPQVVQEEDLDRFAGSSDEDDNEQPLQTKNEKDPNVENPKSRKRVSKDDDGDDSDKDDSDKDDNDGDDDDVDGEGDDGKGEDDDGEGEDDDEEEEEEKVEDDGETEVEEVIEDDDGEPEVEASGMANVMARILGTQIKKSFASAVLAKTTTPLQRMAKEENERLKEAREKRRANREKKLTALHIPLSVATSRATAFDKSSSLVKELEHERTHRRVATRGVVALFNAITQHQKGEADTAKLIEAPKSSQDQKVSKMSKTGFLDMIKQSAGAKKAEPPSKTPTPETDPKKKPTWNALKDDYMLDSSKNWDKESSDEDEDEKVDDNWSDQEDSSPKKESKNAASKKSQSKRRKITSRK